MESLSKSRKRTFKVITLSALMMLLMSYQNCGKAFDAGSVSDWASMVVIGDQTVRNADLAWSTKGRQPMVNRFGRVERWEDSIGKSINLYPPFRANSTVLDVEKSALATSVDGQDYLKFEPGAYLTPAVADLSEFVSEEYTVLIVVRDLKFQEGSTLRFYQLAPANGDAAGDIGLELQPIDPAQGTWRLWAFHWFDGTNHSTLSAPISADQLKGPLAIGMRFDRSPERLKMAINGVVQEVQPVVGGQPSNLGRVSRRLYMKGPGFGSEFTLGDFVIYRRPFSDGELATATYGMRARWGQFDGERPVDPGTGDGSLTFANVESIFTKAVAGQAGNCLSCHSSDVSSRNALLARKNLAGAPWVAPGSPENSVLIKALRRQAGVQAMPPSAAMPEADIQVIEQWIREGAN